MEILFLFFFTFPPNSRKAVSASVKCNDVSNSENPSTAHSWKLAGLLWELLLDAGLFFPSHLRCVMSFMFVVFFFGVFFFV